MNRCSPFDQNNPLITGADASISHLPPRITNSTRWTPKVALVDGAIPCQEITSTEKQKNTQHKSNKQTKWNICANGARLATQRSSTGYPFLWPGSLFFFSLHSRSGASIASDLYLYASHGYSSSFFLCRTHKKQQEINTKGQR